LTLFFSRCSKYEGIGGTCRFTEDAVGATITSFNQVNSGDEQALMQAVATVGPVSVGVDASKGWQLYAEPQTLSSWRSKDCSR